MIFKRTSNLFLFTFISYILLIGSAGFTLAEYIYTDNVSTRTFAFLIAFVITTEVLQRITDKAKGKHKNMALSSKGKI